MRFVRKKGVLGLVYVPDSDGGPKKHPCADCHSCQWCSDERCALCRRKGKCSPPPVQARQVRRRTRG